MSLSNMLILCFLTVLSCQMSRTQNPTTQNKEIRIENMSFVFYNSSVNDFTVIPAIHSESLLEIDYYNSSKPTLFVCIGVATQIHVGKFPPLVDEIIKTKKYNTVVIDVTHYTLDAYFGIDHPRLIGKTIAKAVQNLVSAGLPTNNTECVGHSLGATICGEIAKLVQPKIALIVGLDPWRNGGFFRRGYALHTISLRSDAQYFGDILWDSDTELVANGGVRMQPGCHDSEVDNCSHCLALYCWIDMIKNPSIFFGVECNEIECDYTSIVSNLGPDFRKKGTFHFRTSGYSPYGLGIEGIKDIVPTKNSTFKYYDAQSIDFFSPAYRGYLIKDIIEYY